MTEKLLIKTIEGFVIVAGTKTYVAKPGSVEQKWLLVDADGKIVGRLASQIAVVLMGKHRPTYTPHVDTGDFVVVTNAEKVVFTGKKWELKEYNWYTGYPGLRSETAGKRLEKAPEADSSRSCPPDASQEQTRSKNAFETEDLLRQ